MAGRSKADVGKWAIIILTVIVAVIILILIIVYAAGGFASGSSKGKQATWKGYLPSDQALDRYSFSNLEKINKNDIKMMSLKDLISLCKDEYSKKKLPVPVSKYELQKLIRTVKTFHETANCTDYGIGFVLGGQDRFSAGSKVWSSFESGGRPGVPEEGDERECVLIHLSTNETERDHFTIKQRVKCEEVKDFQCMMVQYGGDKCGYSISKDCVKVVSSGGSTGGGGTAGGEGGAGGSGGAAAGGTGDGTGGATGGGEAGDDAGKARGGNETDGGEAAGGVDSEKLEQRKLGGRGPEVYEEYYYGGIGREDNDSSNTSKPEGTTIYKYWKDFSEKESNPDILGILVIDTDDVPDDYKLITSETAVDCYAMAVKLKYDYQDVYLKNLAAIHLDVNKEITGPATSGMDCVRINALDEFALYRGNCTELGCPLCF